MGGKVSNGSITVRLLRPKSVRDARRKRLIAGIIAVLMMSLLLAFSADALRHAVTGESIVLSFLGRTLLPYLPAER
ncbi:MAG: hypothetical protein HY220_01710 [Candidatus Sungbacteria bacterium]|uniref:Uncharacterized protein n=1 Tax=Candidatus Sungiibacteriota bacterium TaxID=2750080 RepID=A0A9D6LMX7_9BACT|nr:hypothetical protein [Candidatus Sungbacteria bacterium]